MRAPFLALVLSACSGYSDYAPDGGMPCDVTFNVTRTADAVPFTAHVEAFVDGLDGPATYVWSVDNAGTVIPFTESNSLGSAIDFEAIDPGSYVASVRVTAGIETCTGSTTIAAPPPGAVMRSYRLRYTPYQPNDPPPQDDPQVFVVYGGTLELPAGERRLLPGISVTGLVHDLAGSPLSAYLRFIPALGLQATEILVGTSGSWSRQLGDGAYDVIVAPVDELPALSLQGVAVGTLADLAVDAGDAVGGSVVRQSGASTVPVAGARVAVRAGAVPAVMATADASGAWQGRIRAAYGPLSVRIVPLAGLPELAVEGVTVAPGATVHATYASGIASSSYTLEVRTSTGAPLAGATVTLVSTSIPSGGTITIAGVAHPAAASARAVGVSDGAGQLSVTLPNGAYQLVVEPPSSAPGQAPARYTPSLSGGALAPIATVAARSLGVTVRDGAGDAVMGARVTAISRGFAGGLAAGRASVGETDASGVAMVAITPGVAHDVLVDPPLSQPLARARTAITGAETSLAVALPPGFVIHGQVVFPLQTGSPGIRVEAFCLDCDPSGPLVTGETLTRAGGVFDLPVPDPGVE